MPRTVLRFTGVRLNEHEIAEADRIKFANLLGRQSLLLGPFVGEFGVDRMDVGQNFAGHGEQRIAFGLT